MEQYNKHQENNNNSFTNIIFILIMLGIFIGSGFTIHCLSSIADNIAIENGGQPKEINPKLAIKQAVETRLKERDKIIADKKEQGIDTLPQNNNKLLSNNKKTNDSKESYDNGTLSKEEKERIEKRVRTVPNSHVYDKAGLLSKHSINQIIEKERQLDSEGKAQITVETLMSLTGEKIEDYSAKRFRELNLGDNDYNNGIFILVVPTERIIRIERGYGLEDIFSEEEIKDIIKINGIRKFQEQNYDKAIYDLVFAFDKKLKKDISPKTGTSGFIGETIRWN